MGFFNEFKTFIIKGNAIDLAVGIVIGAAFGGVVTSLVTNIIMPPIGFLLGGVDFSNLAITLQSQIPKGGTHPLTNTLLPEGLPAVVIGYGKFINAVIALLIQGFAIFLVVKVINRLKREPIVEPVPIVPPPPTKEQLLLTEIRDLLARR